MWIRTLAVYLSIYYWLYLHCGVFCGTRMLEPPTRASLWRYGYNTPTNPYDDKTNCGGYEIHYNLNNGTCGICGDPANEATPRDHEAGGKFSPSPVPVRVYKKGGHVTIVMETTGTMYGRFEFRICPVADNMETPDQSCFNRNLLTIVESEQGTSYTIGSRQGVHTMNVQLPHSLTCPHCILQWRHVTGFMTNQDTCYQCSGGEQKCHVCLGCGRQVWYTGCTDVAIYDYPLVGATTPLVATTVAPSQSGGCPPCSLVDSQNNEINFSKPYNSHVYGQTTPFMTNSSAPPNMPPNTPLLAVTSMVMISTPRPDAVVPASTAEPARTPQSGNLSVSLLTTKRESPKATPLATTRAKPVVVTPQSTTPPPPPKIPEVTPKPEKPTAQPIVCYITNRKRYPKLSADNLCGKHCPALGKSVCLFQLCVPTPCKSLARGPATPVSSTTTTTIRTTTRTTTVKPLPPPTKGTFPEILRWDMRRPNVLDSRTPQRTQTNRQNNWDFFNMMTLFMGSFEL